MESQGSPSEQKSVRSDILHASPIEFCAQHPAMPPSPFVQGFGGAGNHMPFLYPHSFMSPIPAFGFRPPAHGIPSVTFDLTAGSQKRGQESDIGLSNSNKKRRAPGRNRKLSNWTTTMMIQKHWRMDATGRTIGWFNSSHFGARCKTPLALRQNKVCVFNFSIFSSHLFSKNFFKVYVFMNYLLLSDSHFVSVFSLLHMLSFSSCRHLVFKVFGFRADYSWFRDPSLQLLCMPVSLLDC